jgi:hypothetical protein
MFLNRLAARLAAVILLLLLPGHALAAVTISFYSHEFGSNFPHAFVVLTGQDDRTGEKIDANYGFTATQISPAILMGPVRGEVFSREPAKEAAYIAKSDRHFSFTLSDSEYDAVLQRIAAWQQLKQPSYSLNRQNCVHFVADIAATLGMTADKPPVLMKRPRSFTESLLKANRQWLLARGGVVDREPDAEKGVKAGGRAD